MASQAAQARCQDTVASEDLRHHPDTGCRLTDRRQVKAFLQDLQVHSPQVRCLLARLDSRDLLCRTRRLDRLALAASKAHRNLTNSKRRNRQPLRPMTSQSRCLALQLLHLPQLLLRLVHHRPLTPSLRRPPRLHLLLRLSSNRRLRREHRTIVWPYHFPTRMQVAGRLRSKHHLQQRRLPLASRNRMQMPHRLQLQQSPRPWPSLALLALSKHRNSSRRIL